MMFKLISIFFVVLLFVLTFYFALGNNKIHHKKCTCDSCIAMKHHNNCVCHHCLSRKKHNILCKCHYCLIRKDINSCKCYGCINNYIISN